MIALGADRTRPAAPIFGALQLAALGAAMFAVAWAGITLTRHDGLVASVWLLNAVAVAALLRCDRGHCSAIAGAMVAANVAADVTAGGTLIPSIALALVNLVEALVVASALRRRFGRNPNLADVPPLRLFLFTGGLIAPLLAAICAAAVLSFAHSAPFLPLFERWYLAHALGLVALTPLLLALPRDDAADWRLPGPQALAIIALPLPVAGLIYLQAAPLQALVIPVLLLAAFRLSAATAALAVGLVAIEAAVMTAFGLGPVASSALSPADRMLVLQGFIAVSVLVVLPTNAVIRERDRLTQSLIAARDEATAAAEAKSNFLSTMSHEIRTPMTGVLGMIELLRGDPAEEDRERFFATLNRSATLLMTVLDDILDYSKLESGNLTLEMTDFHFEELAQSTLDLFGHAASQKGLLLFMRSDEGVGPVVRGDPTRIQQVISNLINNAIKFTDEGRITITIVSTALDDDRIQWRVEVSDTGIGIVPGQLESLFQPFTRSGTSVSRCFGGTGLGLSISRWLVDAMGGRIGAESFPRQGSTFWFEVPLLRGATAQWHPRPTTLQRAAHSLDILVAEDNVVNQLLIDATLRSLGHRVTIVENGRLAVDAAALRPFDCILMDLQMPELDGLAATRAIRASHGPCANVPIIALTAEASPDRRRFYDNAGLTDFMTKPIDRLALAARLAAVADAAQAETLDIDPAADDAPLFDTTNLNQLCATIGPTNFDSLLDLLQVEITQRPTAIRLAVLGGDIARARREAHSLKGATMSIGAMALGQAAAMVELAPDLPAMNAALQVLDRQIIRTREAVEALIPRSFPARDSA